MIFFTPRTIAVYLPAGSSAMIADSLAAVGSVPAALNISLTWSLVIIPPITVVRQLSLEAIKAPAAIVQFQGRINQILLGNHTWRKAQGQWLEESPSLVASLER